MKLPMEWHRHGHRHCPIRANQESAVLPPEPICVFKLVEAIPIQTQGPQQPEFVAGFQPTRLRLIRHFIRRASGRA